MVSFERRRRRHTHIEMAPLVDVVFLLLLFFMLTVHFVVEPALRIRLPASQTADLESEEKLVVTIAGDGQTYLGNQPLAVEDLPAALRQAFEGSSEPSVQVKADREVPVGLLIQVVDGVRLAGCNRFSVVTERQ